jgi:molecular chaperone GrpE
MDEREHKNEERDKNVIEFDSRSRNPQEPADPSAPIPPEGAEVAERAARLQAEKDELMQTLVRRQADFENYRKRIERERQEDRRHGTGRLIEDLLPVLDAFERAIKAHDDPAYEEYLKDPHYHQAIERVESDEYPDGTVVEVLQDGFIFHGRVVRPSIVRVSFNAGEADSGKSSAVQRHAK